MQNAGKQKILRAKSINYILKQLGDKERESIQEENSM